MFCPPYHLITCLSTWVVLDVLSSVPPHHLSLDVSSYWSSLYCTNFSCFYPVLGIWTSAGRGHKEMWCLVQRPLTVMFGTEAIDWCLVQRPLTVPPLYYMSMTQMCKQLCRYFSEILANCCQLLLVKFIKHNQNYYLKTWHFDLYQRPSSEEAGTQFFRFLTQREDAMSRKRSYAWLSW